MCVRVCVVSPPIAREEKRIKPEKAAGRSLAAQFREIVTGAILEGEGRRKVLRHAYMHTVMRTDIDAHTHTHTQNAFRAKATLRVPTHANSVLSRRSRECRDLTPSVQKKAKAKDADAAPEKRKPKVFGVLSLCVCVLCVLY